MNVDEALVGVARGIAIFLFWGLVLTIFGFESTIISILVYSLVVKRKLENEKP